MIDSVFSKFHNLLSKHNVRAINWLIKISRNNAVVYMFAKRTILIIANFNTRTIKVNKKVGFQISFLSVIILGTRRRHRPKLYRFLSKLIYDYTLCIYTAHYIRIQNTNSYSSYNFHRNYLYTVYLDVHSNVKVNLKRSYL